MSTWSGIRNKLESDYLCPALRGRIQYFATSYWESHDQTGRAAIRLDGVEVLRSNYYAYEQNYWNRYQALRREGVGEDDPKAPFRMAHEGTLNDGCFDNIFFYEAFHEFDNQSIEKSLTSENPLVRVFALSVSLPFWTAGWESAACLLWRNPWSRSWTGCGPSM